MQSVDLLFGKNISWNELHMWRVKQFTPLAQVENGKVTGAAKGHPYGLLTVEMPRLGESQEAIVAITHQVDFLNLWTIWHGRGVHENQEILVSYCPPQKWILRVVSSLLPKLMFQVFSSGHLDRISGTQVDGLGDAMAASHEQPIEIMCPSTSMV